MVAILLKHKVLPSHVPLRVDNYRVKSINVGNLKKSQRKNQFLTKRHKTGCLLLPYHLSISLFTTENTP